MQMQHFRNSWIATKNIWNTSAIFRGYQLKCFTRFKNSNIENIYDLTNFITKDNGGKETRVIRNLIQDKKYYHLRKTVSYSKSDSSLTKTHTKGSKTFNISYKEWIDKYSWYIWSKVWDKPNHFKFLKGCLLQVLFRPFLNTLPRIQPISKWRIM